MIALVSRRKTRGVKARCLLGWPMGIAGRLPAAGIIQAVMQEQCVLHTR